MSKKFLASLAAVGALAVGIAFTVSGTALASVPAPTVGNVTVLSSAPRLVPSPGSAFAAGETKTFQVAGETFSGTAIPANATGVTISISATNSAAHGKLTVWTTDAGQPGPGTVTFEVGGGQTNVAFVGLNSDGKLNVYASAKTQALISIQSYVTPLAQPQIFGIPAADKTLDHIGPSVRTDNSTPGSGVTDLGNVVLPAGVYDARIIGGFSGLKGNADIPSGVSLLGGLFVTRGSGIPSGFGNVLAQTQGIEIPKTNSGSASYTVDPTAQVSTFLSLNTATEVHVQAYAYSSDGADRAALGVKANIASAQFLKLS